MALNPLSSLHILKDLQEIYEKAMDKSNLSVAFKVKELLGRELGLLGPNKRKISIYNLSDEDISHLIKELEMKLRLDPVKDEG